MLIKSGTKLWNQSQFGLQGVEFSDKSPVLILSKSDFLAHRFTEGLLYDEIILGLADDTNDVEGLTKSMYDKLSLRKALLPDMKSFFDLETRVNALGVDAFLAVAMPDDSFRIHSHKRSGQVGESRFARHVIPAGFHQPIVEADIDKQTNPYWTALRELYEELFGGREVERKYKKLNFDSFLDRCEAVKWLHTNPESWRIEILGLIVNIVNGTVSISTLIVIHDTEFWSKFKDMMQVNWENRAISVISSMDRESMKNELLSNDWCEGGQAIFALGLMRLAELHPENGDYPEITRESHQT